MTTKYEFSDSIAVCVATAYAVCYWEGICFQELRLFKIVADEFTTVNFVQERKVHIHLSIDDISHLGHLITVTVRKGRHLTNEPSWIPIHVLWRGYEKQEEFFSSTEKLHKILKEIGYFDSIRPSKTYS